LQTYNTNKEKKENKKQHNSNISLRRRI